MPFYYKKIPEPDVELKVREQARMILEYCKKRLGLDPIPIKIQWIKKVDGSSAEFDMKLVELGTALRRLKGDYSEINKIYFKDDAEFWGQMKCYGPENNKILIRMDIPIKEIMLSIAHECQHVADNQTYRPPWTDEEKATWEKRAETFAQKIMEDITWPT